MAEYIERETAKAKIREKFKFVPARIEINEVLNSIPAADAIEQLIEERDAYRKAMTDEHNRAAKLAWEKEHCWIPVEERLPKLDENVLVYSAHSGLICIDANIHFDRNVTHWMSLPQPPKEECA